MIISCGSVYIIVAGTYTLFHELKVIRQVGWGQSPNLLATLSCHAKFISASWPRGHLSISFVYYFWVRQKRLNTEIESSYENSKKLNVVGGTCLDLFAINVSTVFLFRNSVSSKEKAFALCSQVAEPALNGLKPSP